MLAVVLGLSSALAWGSADFIAGLQSRRDHVLAVLVLSQLAGTVGLTAVAAIVGGSFPDAGGIAWAGVGAGGGVLALLCFYGALAAGTMSIVAPVSATGAALPVIVGIASGERPGALTAIGLVVAFCGIVLASREQPHAEAAVARAQRRAFGLALLASVGFGLFYIGIDEATKTGDPLAVVAVGRTFALVLVVIVCLGVRPPLPRSASALWRIVAIGALDSAANALYALATREGLLSVVSVLGSLYPAVTIVLAHAILHERLTPWQRAGVLATLAGVILIAAG